MKNAKILLLSLLCIAGFVACDEDDTLDTTPPAVDFNYDPRPAIAGEEVQFYSNPREGSGEIVSWHWEFGDPEGTTSDKRNPQFTYAEEGTYTVNLLVTNEAGNAAQVTRPVNVAPLAFPANIVWSVSNNTTVDENDGSSAPVIGDDGTIYYVESRGGAESSIVAVTDNGSSGTIKWASNEIGHELPNAPSIGPDGNIYINAWHDDYSLNKLSAADGSLLWSGGVGTDVSNNTPAIDSEGNIYHGSRSGAEGGIFSWTSDGDLRWEITDVGAFYSAPVISADESTVYFLNTDAGEIWAVNADDGTTKWTEPVGLGNSTYGSSLSMNEDGTIYYTTNEYVAAVTDNGDTGEVKWSNEDIKGAAQSGVVIGPNGELYVGSENGLVSLNAEDGSINWTYNVEVAESVPAVDVNGNIYIGTTDGELHIISPEGEELRVLELGTGIVNSPTIAEDGTIYVEAFSNETIVLYKISVDGGGQADSFWPMKGRNAKNTSLASN